MGATLDDTLRMKLQDIDTSTVWGEIELNAVKFGLDDTAAYSYKKLQPGKFVLDGVNPSPSICIAYTKEGIIRHISINCSECDRQNIKAILDSAYGKPVVEGNTGYDGGVTTSSFLWSSTAGFDVFFSGIAGSISLSFPNPDEYKKYL